MPANHRRRHCDFCGKTLENQGDRFCGAACSSLFFAGRKVDKGRRRLLKTAAIATGSAGGVIFIVRSAVSVLSDSRWDFQFDKPDGFFAASWAGFERTAVHWKAMGPYFVPRELALFGPSTGMKDGRVDFKLKVAEPIGLAVRTQHSARALAYYDLRLIETGTSTRPLNLKIEEVEGAGRTTVEVVELHKVLSDKRSIFNRQTVDCAVSFNGSLLTAYVNNQWAFAWHDKLGAGTGGIGLVPARGAVVYSGKLVMANKWRMKAGNTVNSLLQLRYDESQL